MKTMIAVPCMEQVQTEFSQSLFNLQRVGNVYAKFLPCSLISKSRTDLALMAVQEKADYLRRAFTGAPGIESVSGLGLMIGLKTAKPAQEVLAICREKGLLALTAKEKIRLLPALNIPMELVREAAEILKDACK